MTFLKQWTKKEQAGFLIRLGECLGDGYPLGLSIRLQLYTQRLQIRSELERMLVRLKNGSSLFEALSLSGFPREICSSIYFAEAGGKLSSGLIEGGTMMLRREEYKEKLARLLRYPLLLIWMLGLMVFVVGRFLLPSFSRLYASLSIELPLTTKILIFVADHVPLFLFLFLIMVIAFLASIYRFRKFSIEKRLKTIIRLPIAGHYIRYYLTHHFSFYIGNLLCSGLSIRQAVATLSENGTTAFLKSEAMRIHQTLLEGEDFETAVSDSSFYLPELTTVIYHGQLNSVLGESLYKYSAVIMARMEEKIRTLLSFFQPVLLLIIGGLVLGLFASVLLPVFQMINGL
ncbi:competence type IV pilus assembly protein ComGB [Sporolactobacillus pectinivorans]|uniref:competence type IV pilus assembly protein ComGB n=1 Tax=Sporolactobacillus pectinivorans TaxID=1591408 RepID=UPI000C26540E|nr:competence type IV pilus assembly protein ComGB [Sporolactobacillus pectinivorans]